MIGVAGGNDDQSNQRRAVAVNKRFPIRNGRVCYFFLVAPVTSAWQTSRIGFKFGRPGSMR